MAQFDKEASQPRDGCVAKDAPKPQPALAYRKILHSIFCTIYS